MNKSSTALILALSVAFSMPAVAGPNWDVIHKAEADKAAHKHEHALVLPLDYGPRAITTPWLNRQRLSQMVSQLDARQGVAHSQSTKKNVVVATHAHRNLGRHS